VRPPGFFFRDSCLYERERCDPPPAGMDFAQLARDTDSTNSRAHLQALQEHVLLQFSFDQNIQHIAHQKVKAQQTIMLRNYLKKYADCTLVHELRGVLETFGKTRDYVGVCLRGRIRLAQADIYALVAVFDTDDFRLQHMSAQRVGMATQATEEYWERASEVNVWRAIVDVEALKIVSAVGHSLSTMKERATALSKQQFVGHPDYAAFCGQEHGEEPVPVGNKKKRID